MPALTKSRPVAVYRDQAARAKLAEAKANLAAVQDDLQSANTARDAARLEYRRARNAVDEIQERIDSLAAQWGSVAPPQREDLQRKVDDCQQPLRDAKRPLMALDIEVERAEAAVKDAVQNVDFRKMLVKDAAEAIVRAEAPQVAEVLIAQLRDAFATIAIFGPDLAWLMDAGFIDRETTHSLGDGPRAVLGAFHNWDDFHRRQLASPWRGVVAALQEDPDAPLPSAPTE